MPIEHTKNGAGPPHMVPMSFFPRQLPGGGMEIRYWAGTTYLGEISIYTTSEDALRAIVEHLYASTPRVVRLT